MKQVVDTTYIHYITGRSDNSKTTTKAGCGLFRENCRTSVYWQNRHFVTCPACIEKINRMEELKSSGKRLTAIDKMYKPFSNF